MSILRSSAVIGHVLRLRAEGFVALRTARGGPRLKAKEIWSERQCGLLGRSPLALGAAGNLRVCSSKRVLQHCNRQGTHL